jgi:flagellar brake protein
MSDTPPALPPPEDDSPANEPYQTYSRREILTILQDVIDRRALITLYFNQGEEHVVTTLLNVNPEFEELVFDSAVRDDMNKRIVQSRRVTFVSFVDQIKIQFRTQSAELTTFEGRTALRIRVPDSVMRLQRREAFRVNTPKAGPLYCEIDLPESGKTRFVIGDLSVGGIGILAGPATFEFKPGVVFDHCRIDLPEHGNFNASLEIRHGNGFAKDAQGKPRYHYGCQFLNLSGPVVNLIQRYINQLERTRRALA